MSYSPEGEEPRQSQQFISMLTQRILHSLDGIWNTAEISGSDIPSHFPHQTPVPGLIDLSTPTYQDVSPPLVSEVDNKFKNFDSYRTQILLDPKRDYFWYQKTFTIDSKVPPIALLKIHKAMYGTYVILNGIELGTHLPNFTPGYFDIASSLKGNGEANELLIRIGASRDTSPSSPINGHDHEKCRYIPGIYDSIELILTHPPFIRNVQIAPDLEQAKIRVQVELEGTLKGDPATLEYKISSPNHKQEADNTGTVHIASCTPNLTLVDFDVPMEGFQKWSPESPHLYTFNLSSGCDDYETRFGMRSFRFGATDAKAYLNEDPYYLLGTNICIFRFFEDSERGALPWDREWVRRLLTEFKTFHWNSFRFSLGSPPEFWYDLADEIGFVVQDEFAFWDPSDRVTAKHLIEEYTEWMRERWNHACVLTWDGQNETSPERGGTATSAAIDAVRNLDLSDRPWDNGWSQARRATDPVEVHLYLLNGDGTIKALSDLKNNRPKPWRWKSQIGGLHENNALICNEYAWMWIDRQGRPGILSKNFKPFENHLWQPEDTQRDADTYRYVYAKTFAMLTEYWRAFGNLAGVQHFAALSYSRLDGHTSDNLIDVQEPRFEPHFLRFAPDAFAPVAIVLDIFRPTASINSEFNGDLVLINDSKNKFEGKVQVEIRRHEDDSEAFDYYWQLIEALPWNRSETSFRIKTPSEQGLWRIVATLTDDQGYKVESIRDIRIE